MICVVTFWTWVHIPGLVKPELVAVMVPFVWLFIMVLITIYLSLTPNIWISLVLCLCCTVRQVTVSRLSQFATLKLPLNITRCSSQVLRCLLEKIVNKPTVSELYIVHTVLAYLWQWSSVECHWDSKIQTNVDGFLFSFSSVCTLQHLISEIKQNYIKIKHRSIFLNKQFQ